MLNDGISIGAIVAINLHNNHIISHFIFTVYVVVRVDNSMRKTAKHNDMRL